MQGSAPTLNGITVDARLPSPPAPAPSLGKRVQGALRLIRPRGGKADPVLVYAAHDDPRYGHGKPAHAALNRLIDARRDRYRAALQRFLTRADDLALISPSRSGAQELEPGWLNRFLPGLDSVSLYCLMAELNPKRYIEVGSGNSTMFARRAVRDNGLRTQITSIDPFPRANIDAICDEVIRRPLGDVDLSMFKEAEAGDIVFLDGSHQVCTGSDVVVAFMDILPELRPGVVVQIHDIWLPYDYPARWRNYLFSEQYMLAVLLLAAPEKYEILLPNMFIASDAELSQVLSPLWEREPFRGVPRHGGSWWMIVR